MWCILTVLPRAKMVAITCRRSNSDKSHEFRESASKLRNINSVGHVLSRNSLISTINPKPLDLQKYSYTRCWLTAFGHHAVLLAGPPEPPVPTTHS